MARERQRHESLIPLRAILGLQAAAIVLVSIFGAIQVARAPIDEDGARPVGTFAPFALDTETNPATAFAALLLVIPAILCAVLAAMRPADIPRWALLATGAVLAFMVIDEWAAIHEELDSRTDTTWQLLYLPLGIAAAVPWFFVLRGLRRYPPAALAWLAAAALWVLAQVLNLVAPTDDRAASASYRPLVITEEILELTGSLLFQTALLIVLAAVLEGRAERSRTRQNPAAIARVP